MGRQIELVPLVAKAQEWMEFSENPLQRIRTGYPSIDELCGGPAPGEVFMFLGRSFTGKSIVIQNILVHNMGVPSLFFSLEMPDILAMSRWYAMWSDTPMDNVTEMTESGSLPRGHIESFSEENFRSYLVTDAAVSLDEMSNLMASYDYMWGERPQFVLIDYLELIGGAKQSGEGWQATEMQATSLKDFAKSENVAVFVAHQANRTEDSWKPPTENSARGAGYTESDFVVGIWQKVKDPTLTYAEFLAEKDMIHMNVIKNRVYGKVTGRKELLFRLQPSLRLKDLQHDLVD